MRNAAANVKVVQTRHEPLQPERVWRGKTNRHQLSPWKREQDIEHLYLTAVTPQSATRTCSCGGLGGAGRSTSPSAHAVPHMCKRKHRTLVLRGAPATPELHRPSMQRLYRYTLTVGRWAILTWAELYPLRPPLPACHSFLRGPSPPPPSASPAMHPFVRLATPIPFLPLPFPATCVGFPHRPAVAIVTPPTTHPSQATSRGRTIS